MAFSESLALRIRQVLGHHRGVVEKKMFGAVGFLLNGNMCVGVWKNSLIVRLDAQDSESTLNEPNVVAFDITGRPMKGWVMIEPDGIESEKQLNTWVQRAMEFVKTLPAKSKESKP
jgi:TfoX/Sxy family transcriptional regulator of competence genes